MWHNLGVAFLCWEMRYSRKKKLFSIIGCHFGTRNINYAVSYECPDQFHYGSLEIYIGVTSQAQCMKTNGEGENHRWKGATDVLRPLPLLLLHYESFQKCLTRSADVSPFAQIKMTGFITACRNTTKITTLLQEPDWELRQSYLGDR